MENKELEELEIFIKEEIEKEKNGSDLSYIERMMVASKLLTLRMVLDKIEKILRRTDYATESTTRG